MSRKLLRLAMTAAGMSLAVGALSACSDDSTATAPITSNPVTTTSMYASSASASTSAAAPSSSTPTAAPSGTSGTAAGQGLPATAPQSAANNADENSDGNSDGQAPGAQPISAKGQKYLNALKSDNVSFMGDTDNNIALTMAQYVCAEQRKGTDPVTVKAFITASVGPGTKTVAEANAKADKVINAAHDNFC